MSSPEPQPIRITKIEIMNKKLNKVPSAGTKADSSTGDDVNSVSQHSRKPNVGRSFLKSLEIDANEEGFVIWVKEKKKIGKKLVTSKHWVMDGSMLKKDGFIRMGEKNMYKIEARYNDEGNFIEIGR